MEKEFEAKAPDYAGDGFAVWKAEDKNGKVYLKIKQKGWKESICCFKVEPKQLEEKKI